MDVLDKIFLSCLLLLMACFGLMALALALNVASRLIYETFHFWGWM